MVYKQMESWFPNAIPGYDQELFGRYLEAMDEQPVYAKRAANASIYQLLWLRMRDRPGSSPAIFVRIEQTSPTDLVQFVVKKTQESGDDRVPGNLIVHEEKTLTAEQLRTLEAKLGAIDFWSIPTFEKGPLGGELWLLEALHEDRYNAVDRCCLEVAVGTVLDKTANFSTTSD
jgi:hypothetical protein